MVPVSMMLPAKVSRSTIAAHRRGSVNVFVHPGKRLVRGDGDRGGLFPLGEHLEEQLGSAPRRSSSM
jgi:hypothetical protein